MKRVIISIFAIKLLAVQVFAQQHIEPRVKRVFLDRVDSAKNCYTICYPPKIPWSGYLFLVPGFGETAEEVMQQTDLPIKLARNGILTIIPTFQDGVLSLGVDPLSQQSFTAILNDVRNKHKLTGLRFYVGGFSIGGSCVIKYAENSVSKPSAVFAIDPPLDFQRFYYAAKRDVRLSLDKRPSQESIYMIDRLEKETGGTPGQNLASYYEISPYSFSDSSQSAIKKLTNVPIRLYTEPDVNWWIKERRSDLTSMNATECSAMINELIRLGNDHAALMVTENRGYRKPGHLRHPHSWSIVDDEELVRWLLDQK
jgi:hypothetical protein